MAILYYDFDFIMTFLIPKRLPMFEMNRKINVQLHIWNKNVRRRFFCIKWLFVSLIKDLGLKRWIFFGIYVFVWRSTFSDGGGARCRFIAAAEGAEGPVPAAVSGALWHQGRGRLLSTTCGSVQSETVLWSVLHISYILFSSDSAQSFHGIMCAFCVWKKVQKINKLLNYVLEFENWYEKSFPAPEEELDITMETTREQVSPTRIE